MDEDIRNQMIELSWPIIRTLDCSQFFILYPIKNTCTKQYYLKFDTAHVWKGNSNNNHNNVKMNKGQTFTYLSSNNLVNYSIVKTDKPFSKFQLNIPPPYPLINFEPHRH